METGHFNLVGNLPNINVVELPSSAAAFKPCHASKSFGNVAYFSAIYGVCCLATIAENLL
jgi:hypothetical protein